MIDNFELITEFIKTRIGEGEFYFLQILRRRKDNPDNSDKHAHLIDSFFIRSAEDLTKNAEKIKQKCQLNNARAYIRLNKRSDKKVALETLRLVTECICSENYDVKNCYLSACGIIHNDEEKKWLVDIDTKDEKIINDIKQFVDEQQPISPKSKTLLSVPTKNGLHLITVPFRLDSFKQKFADVDVHKDNPTILYIP